MTAQGGGGAEAAAFVSAQQRGLRGCPACGLVSRAADALAATQCPRCGVALPARKPESLQRTVAYLIASAILYVPANLMPVMTTTSVLGESQHTILGGIVELWQSGSWELAIIVWIASIGVPIGKIVVLSLLVYTAYVASPWRMRERATLYRIVQAVGHWSMLDIYVVVLLAGMVRFGAFASVRPEPGLLAFGTVVVLTVLAASSFDPRLLWARARRG
jgi:paraquat-inducible protein A